MCKIDKRPDKMHMLHIQNCIKLVNYIKPKLLLDAPQGGADTSEFQIRG